MRATTMASLTAAGLSLLLAGAAEARPERCQKVLMDAGRKYVAMIYATEHRDCTYRPGAHCDKPRRRDHYVSLRGGKVPRKCSDADVRMLAGDGLLQWDECDGEMNQEGLGQCFLDYFEARAEAWVDLIYESDEIGVCKDRLFAATLRYMQAAGREEMRCRSRKLRRGDHGSCRSDTRYATNLARQQRRFLSRACGSPVLVDTLLDLATQIDHDTIGFADARYLY